MFNNKTFLFLNLKNVIRQSFIGTICIFLDNIHNKQYRIYNKQYNSFFFKKNCKIKNKHNFHKVKQLYNKIRNNLIKIFRRVTLLQCIYRSIYETKLLHITLYTCSIHLMFRSLDYKYIIYVCIYV